MMALNNINKIISKRVGVYLAIAIILANVIISPLTLAAGAVDKMTIDKQVAAYAYYYAWSKCIDKTNTWSGGSTSISMDNAVSGKWFSTSTGLGAEDGIVGYTESTNGIIDCNGTEIVNNALPIWGFSSDKTSVLVNDFKFTKNGDEYVPSDKYATAFLSAIRNKAFGGQTPMMSDAAKYYFFSESFKKACSPSLITSPTPDQITAAKSGSSEQYGMLMEYDTAKKGVVEHYFEMKGDIKMSSSIDNVIDGNGEVARVLGSDYGDGEARCRTLATDANKYAAAYARYAASNPSLVPTSTTPLTTGSGTGVSNCVLEGIGWIVCPVVRSIAFMIDKVFALLQIMLITPPLPITPNASTNPLYGAWSGMRNIANVVFVIAFMIIIYSQITSAGVSNYGIKKMLPKLIVSAILINVSFWLCVLAVDLSNVLGSSIYNVLTGLNAGGGNGSWVAVVEVLLGAGAVGALAYGGITIGVAALGAGGLGMALLWLAIPMIIAVAIAIIIGATVLALRQALIIILIFVSPLAFAAYLLPNTQEWFDKWKKLFVTMLVFYPLFAVLFGGAAIASYVLISAASTATAKTAGVILLTGMLIQFLPLFLVPALIKTSSGLLGKVATKMQGGMNKASSPINKMARGRTAASLGLAKGKLLTGSTTATNRRGRRTFMSRVNGLAQNIDSSGRTRKMMQEDLDTTREANWANQVAHDQDLAALDTNTRAEKLRKEGSDAYREADWQEQVAQDPGLHVLHTDEKVQKARAGSAQRRQEKEYLETLEKNGQELYTAAGIDPRGEERVLASVVAAQQKSNREAVENSKALLYNEDPGLTIERATAQLRRASADGDVVAGRAAAQVLRESGTPGKQALHDTVVQLEQNGGIHNEVAQGVKADGLASGAKGYDSAIDRWYAETDKVDANGNTIKARTLFTLATDSGSASRLNEPELAGQTAKILQEWERSGVLTQTQAQSVLDAHARGTVPLDPAKFEIFTRAAKSTPMQGPVGPPPVQP